MNRLPVSGARVTVLAPTGQEDVMLLEAADLDLALAVRLLRRLVTAPGGEFDLTTLAVTDYEALLLGAHAAAFGEVLRAEVFCGRKSCGTRADVSFEVDDYIAHHRPRRPPNVVAIDDREGWFELHHKSEARLQYRLPVVADLIAIDGDPEPERAILRRCVDGPPPEGPLRRNLEKAMEAQAPSLSGPVEGRCPACGAALQVSFDVQGFVLQELRDQAAFVYYDTHLLALHYHWPEIQILEMPRNRRMQYAEMLRGEA